MWGKAGNGHLVALRNLLDSESQVTKASLSSVMPCYQDPKDYKYSCGFNPFADASPDTEVENKAFTKRSAIAGIISKDDDGASMPLFSEKQQNTVTRLQVDDVKKLCQMARGLLVERIKKNTDT